VATDTPSTAILVAAPQSIRHFEGHVQGLYRKETICRKEA